MDGSLDQFMREKVRLREYGEGLEKLASDCETNYVKAGNAQARSQAFQASRQSAAKALTDVAYRINLLAQTLVNVLENQTENVKRLDAEIGQLDTQADGRLETAAKQRVFDMTAKKPPVEERPKVDGPKYQRRAKVEMKKFPPVNYNSLDSLGHGLILTPHTSVGRLSGVVDMDKFRAKQAIELNLPPDKDDEDANTDQAVEDMYSKLRKGRSPSKSKIEDDENVYEKVDADSPNVGGTFGSRTLERRKVSLSDSFSGSTSPSLKAKTLPPPSVSVGKISPRLALNRKSSHVSRPKFAPPPPPTKPSPSSTNGTATTNQNASTIHPPPPPANQSEDTVAPPPSPDDDQSNAGTGSFLAAIKAAKLKSRDGATNSNGAPKKEGVRVSVNDWPPPPPP